MKISISKLLLLLLLLLLLGAGVFAAGIAAKHYNIINLDPLFCDKSRFSYINKELACGDALIVKKHIFPSILTLRDMIGTPSTTALDILGMMLTYITI